MFNINREIVSGNYHIPVRVKYHTDTEYLQVSVEWITDYVARKFMEDTKLTYKMIREMPIKPLNQFTIYDIIKEYIGFTKCNKYDFDIKYMEDGIIYVNKYPDGEKESD